MLIANGPVHVEPWIAAAAKVKRMVCAIEKPYDRNAGTGFLIAPDLVMTAYHVVAEAAGDPTALASLRVTFDRHLQADRFRVGRPSAFAVRALADASPRLDFAVLALEWPAGEEEVGGGAMRGWVDVPQRPYGAAKDSILTVVHHPRSEALYLSAGAVTELAQRGTRVRYRANTEPGSSGAPCFDYRWNLVAIHLGTRRTRAGAPLYAEGVMLTEVKRVLRVSAPRRSPCDLHSR